MGGLDLESELEAAPSKKPATHMSNTFHDRIARGNNLTKMGNSSSPRDTAMLIAAQARSCVDCPTLQAVGPQATNQAVKSIAIARTFLKQSDSIDICMQPEFVLLEDGHTGLLLQVLRAHRAARRGHERRIPRVPRSPYRPPAARAASP